MVDKDVIIEELGPGMTLYRPAHKSRVIDAVRGYFEGQNSKRHEKRHGRLSGAGRPAIGPKLPHQTPLQGL